MEQNAVGLRKRLEGVNDSIKTQMQKTAHQKQAMQLLNLWRGRRDYFPGLRPNAMQLRYEPTRTVDDLLANPLAIEFLKSHCENDRSLENLWFILDVSWLQEVESAEESEEDEAKRSQIHDIVKYIGRTIMQRYFVKNAPRQINVSSEVAQKLRDKGDQYTHQMFDEAISEVKMALNTDILPRFQKSGAYSAMSEALFIDSAGGGESEVSEDTLSTSGSILTDDATEGEGGVTHVFAHTFKTLQTTFDVGHNRSASDASSSHAAVGGVIQSDSISDEPSEPMPKKKEEPKKEEPKKEEPKKEEPKKEEPKKEEPKKEEPKKEEPAKKESEQSSESGESSSSGSSSDLTPSTSSTSDDDSDDSE